MTSLIRIPDLDTATTWRKAARRCLVADIPPEDVVWRFGEDGRDLFAEADVGEEVAAAPRVPRAFVELAETVAWHNDPERFAQLYSVLWRLVHGCVTVDDRGDHGIARLHEMAKAVHRCQHKMKAFVRFRDLGSSDGGRPRFGAWFEPTHYTLEPTAPFFAARFGDMDWQIATPFRTATFVGGELRFGPGAARPTLPEDGAETLWATYFRSIFNPARLKPKAMQSQMPRKYWHNMPETRLIPELVAGAAARAQAMRDAGPSQPPNRADRIKARAAVLCAAPVVGGLDGLRTEASACTRCPLHRQATQVVMGEGPSESRLMIVGEQPGDQEDLAGRAFVGPAGRLFDTACAQVGLDRAAAFVANAVKHFKFEPRGKRRLHRRPDSGEIAHCRWWLDQERAIVRPRLLLALGATAAEALTGSGAGILRRRGTVEAAADGTPVFLTVHPSYLLRLPDEQVRAAETERFRQDLARARDLLETFA